MNEISVIIPTYQHADTIGACLNSYIAQTLPPKELIVIDDGSTDQTQEIVASCAFPIIYHYQENCGAPMARNNGAKLATGSFLLFSDADIVAAPTMLEQMYKMLTSHPEADICYSGFLWGTKRFRSKPFNAIALQTENYIHTTSLIRANAFPGFDPVLKRFQDWDLWLTMIERGSQAVALNDILFRVQHVPGRQGISTWLPSFYYKMPWYLLGWKPKALQDFEIARGIILTKHHLL